MISQQLLNYIKQQLKQGTSEEQIKNSLAANGWQAQDIEDGFSSVSNTTNQSSPLPPSTQVTSSLPGVSAIFGQTWNIYKQRLGTFLGIIVIPMLIMMVVTAIFFVAGGSLGIVFLFSKFTAGSIGLFILLALLFFIIISVIQAWGQVALLYAIKDNSERIGIIESYKRGWHKILSYFWVYLLVSLVVFGGFLLLIVPGILFAVWFSFAIFILVAENLKGVKALSKSKEYVKGHWWGVFWRFFFIEAVISIIYLIFIPIFSLLKIPFAPIIGEFIAILFLTPFGMTYLFMIYNNLKALKR